MLKRPNVNPIMYLSPSSFLEWKHCPEKFWIKRISGHRVRGTQGIPAAMGSAFDVYIKRYLAHKLGLQNRPDLLLDNLLASIEIDDSSLRDEVLAAGHNIAERYIALDFANRILKEGLIDVNISRYSNFGSLAIHGKPDAILQTDDLLVPMDWKIRGYKSKHGYSPTPGYKVYVTNDGNTKLPHTKAGTPLEELNYDWAVQVCMYTWMLNNIIIADRDLPVAIDEISFGSNNVVFTQIRTIVTKEFSNTLLRELLQCWNECNNPPDTVYEDRKCNKYNMLCDCAEHCYAYQSHIQLGAV